MPTASQPILGVLGLLTAEIWLHSGVDGKTQGGKDESTSRPAARLIRLRRLDVNHVKMLLDARVCVQ
jgi:hypothetical protein